MALQVQLIHKQVVDLVGVLHLLLNTVALMVEVGAVTLLSTQAQAVTVGLVQYVLYGVIHESSLPLM